MYQFYIFNKWLLSAEAQPSAQLKIKNRKVLLEIILTSEVSPCVKSLIIVEKKITVQMQSFEEGEVLRICDWKTNNLRQLFGIFY